MSRTLKVVIDASDPQRLAAFWAEALEYTVRGSVENYTLLSPVDGHGPQLLLQRVEDPKTTKNRVHLDITCTDVAAEVERLEALGADRASDAVSEHGSSWIVMRDPEGNEFCVCDGGGGTGSR